MDTCSSDDVFGPVVDGCRGGFDFTLLFEQSILSIGPSAIFLLLVPVKLFQLLRANIKTLPNRIFTLKALVSLVLVGLKLALLVTWAENASTRASVPSAVLSFADSIALLLLVSFGHSRSIRPLSIVTLYLIASVSFDAVELRTLYLKQEPSAILGLSSASLGVKLLLLLFETQSKRRYLRFPYRHYSSEATSGIVNRSLFWWLNPLIVTGFKKILTLNDLNTSDPELQSDYLQKQLEQSWDKYQSTGDYALIKASAYCLRWQIASVFFPRLFLIGFNYAQPFLISEVITYIGQPVDADNQNSGYGLIGATILVYVGIAISNVQYQHRIFRTVTMFRGAMVSLIYARTLKLQAGAYDESAALTLMSTDIDRITNTVENIFQVWARLVEVALGIWLLERQLGWVCVAPIVVVLIGTYGTIVVSKTIGAAQKTWLGAIQRRVAITSSILGSMKSVRMLGIEDVLSTTIQNLRVRELVFAAKFRRHSIWRNMIMQFPSMAGPLAAFVIFVIQSAVQGSASLSVVQAFTSVAIISLMASPAGDLLFSIPAFGMTKSCFDRIQKFLLSQSWVDARSNLGATGQTESDGPRLSTDFPLLPLSTPSSVAVMVSDATVEPSSGAAIAIKKATFSIARGSFTMIVGPISSGKTTLLKAILGELPCLDGCIEVQLRRMAYCSQSVWLPNGSIQEIITGASDSLDIDQQWYSSAVHACALDDDIAQLPEAHETVIGSKGLKLSGGQKQRLALARAVYARQDIVLLDDILSALDSTVEEAVINRLLAEDGLFRKLKTTVIFAGHAWRPLPLANKIIVLNSKGSIECQGTWQSLVEAKVLDERLFTSSSKSEAKEQAQDPAKAKALPKAVQGPSANDIDELNRKTGDFSLYKYYAVSLGWKVSTALLVTVICNAVTELFPQIWLKLFTQGTTSGAALFCVLYVVFVLSGLASLGASMWVMFEKGIPRSGAYLHEILLRTVFNASQSFFDKTDRGVTLNRFSQDMSLVDSQLVGGVIITLQAGVNSVILLCFVAIGSSYMGLTIPLLAVALYLLQKVYLRTSRQMRFLDLEAKSPLYSHFLETLEGLSTIRALGWQERFQKANHDRLDASQRPFYLLYCIQRYLNLVLGLLIGAMATVVVALAVNIRSSTNTGSLGVALAGILSLDTNLQYLMTWWTQLETSLGAISRTRSFERQTPLENRSEEIVIPPPDWPSRGAIEFQNVSASYNTDSPNPIPALHSTNLSIPPAKKTALIGRTGSGKSTLLSLIMRTLDYSLDPTPPSLQTPQILIDNIPLHTIPRSLLRRRLIALPQDPFFLAGSVRLNADPTETIPDDIIVAALEKVGIWPILAARGGLDADMSDQGSGLSGGEGQVFALGRAVLRKYLLDVEKFGEAEGKSGGGGGEGGRGGGGVLLLDEATSHTDAATDQRLQGVIREVFQGWTVLAVAHRIETVRDAEVVVVLEQGRVVKVGGWEEVEGMVEGEGGIEGIGEASGEVEGV